jgi:hypothetical protein
MTTPLTRVPYNSCSRCGQKVENPRLGTCQEDHEKQNPPNDPATKVLDEEAIDRMHFGSRLTELLDGWDTWTVKSNLNPPPELAFDIAKGSGVEERTMLRASLHQFDTEVEAALYELETAEQRVRDVYKMARARLVADIKTVNPWLLED